MNIQSLRERRIDAPAATDAGHETGRAASSQNRAVSPAGIGLLIPDVTLPEFVLERAAIRAHRRALIEASTAVSLPTASSPRRCAKSGMAFSRTGCARTMLWPCAPRIVWNSC